jgi:hypothetical protein
VEGAKFVVGRRAYSVVVIGPGMENMDAATAALLEKYVAAGGTVLAFDEAPARVNGEVTDRITKLAAQNSARWLRVNSPDDAAAAPLLHPAGFSLKWDPATGGKLFHQRRQLNDGQLVYLVNSSLEQNAAGTLRMKGAALNSLSLTTGAVEAYPARAANGELELSFNLPPAGSLLLVAANHGTLAAAKPAPAKETPIRATAPIAIRRTQPNALTIDYCDLKLDGKTDTGIYYYTAAKKIFQHYGFEANPWDAAVQYKTSILDRNHFPAGSGFEATFHFNVADAKLATGLKAVIERPALWKVTINGKPVSATPGAWWLDRAFGVYDISAAVVAGDNAITLKASPMSVHAELEPIYITGDFGVAPQPSGWKLVPATALSNGAWKQQGLPFYSYTVAYSATYRVAAGAGRLKVKLGKWNGTVAEVLVNGRSAGTIGWQPYEADVTRFVRPGANRVEVVVYGSLKNLLGPHHPPINRGLTGPPSFRNAPAATPAGDSYDLEPYGLLEEFQLVRASN